jgi:hypothetical protein
MAVSHDPVLLRKIGIQMQCDLLNAGLVPGVDKCVWEPVPALNWNGLRFDMEATQLSILPRRIEKAIGFLRQVKEKFPNVTYREIARLTGIINSMALVFEGKTQIHTKMLQMFVNIRNAEDREWDSPIRSDFLTLFACTHEEIELWEGLLLRSNCRPFQKPEPNWLVWTDASDYALGGYALKTVSGKNANVFTVDNLLLQPDGVYKALKKHVQLRAEAVQLNTFPLTVRDIFDIDITGVERSIQCFRPFLAWESAADSNERELIAVSLHVC